MSYCNTSCSGRVPIYSGQIFENFVLHISKLRRSTYSICSIHMCARWYIHILDYFTLQGFKKICGTLYVFLTRFKVQREYCTYFSCGPGLTRNLTSCKIFFVHESSFLRGIHCIKISCEKCLNGLVAHCKNILVTRGNIDHAVKGFI